MNQQLLQMHNQMVQMHNQMIQKYAPFIEIWRKIDGYDNYSVSSFGRIRNNKRNIIVKQRCNKNGYYRVNLYKNNQSKTMQIHRLVALAFIGNPSEKPCVDHIDNNRKNNKISNLRWATSSQNQMNKGKQSNNKSGIIGVCWHKRDNRWSASIKIDGITKHIGYFKSIEQAKQARIKAVNSLFGDYAHSSQKR
jgi:hypothetical protein